MSKKIIKKKGRKKVSNYYIIKIVLFIAFFISLSLAIKSLILNRALIEKNKSENIVSENIVKVENIEEFIFEVYDLIKARYWEKITDEQLSLIYNAGIKKLSKLEDYTTEDTREGIKKFFNIAVEKLEAEKKKKFAIDLSHIVLANLKPLGRSGLYSQVDEKALRENVANIDKSIDLFKELDIKKEASQEEIEEAYKKKSEELNDVLEDDTKSKEEKNIAIEKKNAVNRAIETLENSVKRNNYKKTGIESTVKYEILTPNIFYIALKKISPTTFDEFQLAVDEVDKEDELNTLILDLRGNVGGSIDLMQYFLGPFIGIDQYGYDFYHQGEKTPYKTKIGWMPGLVRYKKVVILIDELTQSSAEIMAATLKKYNVGVLVGKTTRGWGTVENTFPIKTNLNDGNKYSAFLVHSITLREDNQPIEGRGVDPHVNINSENWENEFKEYYSDVKILNTVRELIGSL